MEGSRPGKAGFVAVVGKPNVGKSTLVNHVVGHKVSIVSDKAQTTRRRVLGIATTDNWQIAFVDTPGLHEPHTQLGRLLNEAARSSLADVDLVLVMVDCSRMPGKEDKNLARVLAEENITGGSKPVVLCMNKMDLLRASDVQRNYEAYLELFPCAAHMMTSFRRKDNIDKLVDLLLDHLPEGPPLFPEDDYTDQPVRFMAAEFIREKALRLTRQEVPHSLGVLIEDWKKEGGRLIITASILVEKDGQKAILIGKGGAMLKQIGTEARLEIEDLTSEKVYLELFVKVREGWRGNMGILRDLDYFG